MNHPRTTSGFTFAELLIVIAIIIVLTILAIPAYTAQLESANEQVDAANMRAAESLGSATYLLAGLGGDTVVYYAVKRDDNAIILVPDPASGQPKAYTSASDAKAAARVTGESRKNRNSRLIVSVTEGGVATAHWQLI